MLKIFIMMNSIVANTKEAEQLENSIDPELMAKFISHDVFKMHGYGEYYEQLNPNQETINLLNNREAKINNLDSNGKSITLTCELKLEKTFGYTTEMRNLTRGRGSHEIEYIGHF